MIQVSLPMIESRTAKYHQVFKDFYYHLYSNSKSSRAEKIFDDIAKLILVKIFNDLNKNKIIDNFINSKGTANEMLLPPLVEEYGEYINTSHLFSLGDKAIRSSLSILKDIDFSSVESNILGDAFESIIGTRLRGDKGQFFTPKSVVKAMVEIAAPKNGQTIIDPAAGTGSFLIESYKYVKNSNSDISGEFIGIEKDSDLVRFGGPFAKSISKSKIKLYSDNSLQMKSNPLIGCVNYADIVLTNPPFGTKIGVGDQDVLKNYSLGHDWNFSKTNDRWSLSGNVLRKQDPQTLFIELCVNLLKPGGLLGIILPEGLFGNRKTGYVWDFIETVGSIEAMIDCPRTTFQPYTDTKTNIVFIRKGSEKKRSHVKIAVAKHCGHDKRGKEINSNNDPIENDFSSISQSYVHDTEGWWKECEISDRYYVVPRFYYKKANDDVVDFAKSSGGEVITFGDLVKHKILRVRKGHEVGSEAYGSGEIPFVRTSDLTNWEISSDPTNGVSEDVYAKYKRSQSLKADDVLLVADGRYKIGKTAIVQKFNVQSVIQSHIKIITSLKEDVLSGYELLYLLNIPCVLDEMRNLVFIQSTLGSLGKRLECLQIPIPKKTDEWNDKINTFKDVLQKRAALLEEIKKIKTPEAQL